MKIRKSASILTAIFIMISIIALSSISQKSNNQQVGMPADKKVNTMQSTADTCEIASEMRGIWISYMELSMENESDKSEPAFKNKFSKIAENCKNFGFNTLIVQVRPFCDALYKSKYFPYSHILTGTQGKNPKYDPLKIICDICKDQKLAVHAWINPYRISLNNSPSKLSENNPYVKNNSLGIEYDNGIYLDPSNEAVRDLIVNGIIEIVKNYDIDGIQFDDYFYPTTDINFDRIQYEKYIKSCNNKSYMNLENWRIANVNMLVCEVYRAIHNAKDNIIFGISPQGNINNNASLYADVYSWCNCRGFVDYICPQIYFSLENPALSFEESLKSWCELEYSENVKLYIGLAGYKAGSDCDDNTWLNHKDILTKEYNILKKNKSVSGFMLYSYESLENLNAQSEMENLKQALN